MKNEAVSLWVKKYFKNSKPKQAYVMFNNEYNDEGYDTSLMTILVFDQQGNELVPDKGKAILAREDYPDIWDYIRNIKGDDPADWKGKDDDNPYYDHIENVMFEV